MKIIRKIEPPRNNASKLQSFKASSTNIIQKIALPAATGVVSLLLAQVAIADNIDTRGNPNNSTFGYNTTLGNYAYIGQSFTTTANQTRLDRFTFWGPGNNDSSVMTGYVYRFDTATNSVIGTALYSGSVQTGELASIHNPGPSPRISFSVSTGGIQLEVGQHYILLISSQGKPLYFSTAVSGAYAQGTLIRQSNSHPLPTSLSTVPTDDLIVLAELGIWVGSSNTAELYAQLQLQSAQQGALLSATQARAVLGQLRQRMHQGNVDQGSTGSIVHSYAREETASTSAFNQFGFHQVDALAGWTAWADTGADALRGQRSSDLHGYQMSQQFGLDHRFANGWVAGTAIGTSYFSSDFNQTGAVSGNAYWINPYLGMQFDEWLVALNAAYTYSDYRRFNSGAAGQDGSTHGHRFSGSVSVSKQFDLGNGFYLTPEVSVAAGREVIADHIPSTQNGNPSYVTGKLGSELGYQLTNGTRVYGALFGEYLKTTAKDTAASASQDYQSKDWSAAIATGFDLPINDSAKISLEGRVSGLGSETIIYGGNARLSVQF